MKNDRETKEQSLLFVTLHWLTSSSDPEHMSDHVELYF
jgi:hypothetical protein